MRTIKDSRLRKQSAGPIRAFSLNFTNTRQFYYRQVLLYRCFLLALILPMHLVVPCANGGWLDWQEVLVDEGTFYHGVIRQVTVSSARNDGFQRIYVYGDAPADAGISENTCIYEFSWGSGTWHKVLVADHIGGPSWPLGSVFSVGDGRNDGVNRVYCQAGWYNIGEFTYQGGAWTENFFYEGGYPHEPTIGVGRDDGINRLYCPGRYVVCELTYDCQVGEWIYSWLPDSQQSDSVCVAALRSSTKRVYASWAGQVYEYQWNGSEFVRSASAIASVGSTLQFLVSGDGRNSGAEALYCGAENGHIYEVRWTGAAWQATDLLGSISGYSHDKIESIAIGDGRNDGICRVYAGCGDYCYELTFSGGTWSKEMVGEGGRVALGKARGDGITRVYAGDLYYLYEYTWAGSVNHDPDLSNGSVSPSSGDTSTDFYWYVDYYDSDGDSPPTKDVYIDGTSYTMSLYSGSASNGTYRYGPKKLGSGSHNYYFNFTDGKGGSDRLPSSGTCPGPNTDGIPGVVYVDDDYTPQTPGWDIDRFANIQDGIDAVQDGGTVIVSDGLYMGDGNRDIDFEGKALTLRSQNGPAYTRISCGGTFSDPHRAFYFNSGEDESCVIDGFMIDGGYANATLPGYGNGGGIFIGTRSSPTIKNNEIIWNTATGVGGGIYCCYESAPLVTDNWIVLNTASYGGGIGLYDEGNVALLNNRIEANKATNGGGGIYSKQCSSPVVTNCTITGSSARYGGAIFSLDSHMSIVNCTITGNKASSGGGLYLKANDPWAFNLLEIINTILWENSATEGSQISMVSTLSWPYQLGISSENSDIQGGQISIHSSGSVVFRSWYNNIDANPLFIDLGNWDGDAWGEGYYNLRPYSPCIDSGVRLEEVPLTDIRYYPRYDDRDVPNTGTPPDIIDIGAYERQTDSGATIPVISIIEDVGVANDDNITFGTINIGDEASENFGLCNTGTGMLIVTNIEIAGSASNDYAIDLGGDNFEIAVMPSDCFTVGVVFAPQEARSSYDAQLVIHTNDPINPQYVVELSGSAYILYAVCVGLVQQAPIASWFYMRGDLDAQAVHSKLKQYANWAPANPEVIIIDGNADISAPDYQRGKEQIEAAIDQIKVNIKSGDSFIFFYSGHGSADTVDGDEAPINYSDLILHWGLHPNADEALVFHADGSDYLSDDVLKQELDDEVFKEVNKIVILASCMSGGFWGTYSNDDIGDLEKLSNIGLLAAAPEGTNTFMDWDGRVPFAKAVAEALVVDSEGFSTADQAGDGLSFGDLAVYLEGYDFSEYEGQDMPIAGFGPGPGDVTAPFSYELVAESSSVDFENRVIIPLPGIGTISLTKCLVKAGKSTGQDSIKCSGIIDVNAAEIANADEIYVEIWSDADDYLVYNESINLDLFSIKKTKYRYKGQPGAISSFKLDLNKNKFSLQAKNIELTGLGCPLSVEIEIGDYFGVGQAGEDIVNGKKPIPIQLMSGYADTLRADKVKFKVGKAGKGDQLQVKGGFALANPSLMELHNQKLILTWGTQTFTTPTGSFPVPDPKKPEQWKCKKIQINEGGIINAKFNMNKCSFKIKLSGADINPKSGTVDFGIAFGSFDETVEADLD